MGTEMIMNDCQNCDHKQNPQGGHCYMFREEPITKCMKYIPYLGLGAITLPAVDQSTANSIMSGLGEFAVGAADLLVSAASSVGDGVCAVGEGAGAVVGGIAECAGDILSGL